MIALLVGGASCAETPEPAQDNSIEAIRTRANAGDADAQFNLGLMYDNGRGVPQDDGEAVAWYRQAAEQGHASAQFNLGVAYRDGQGVPQDDVEAERWWRKAAMQGDAEAQFNLGLAYENGFGVPKDGVEAYKWFTLARTSAGISIAASELDWTLELKRFADKRDSSAERLTPDQRAEGQRRAAGAGVVRSAPA